MKRALANALCPLVFAACAGLPALSAHAQTPDASGSVMPPGVRSLYAHKGDNSIIAYATPDGYANVRALVKHLDGDLDIIRTDVSLVTITSATLKTLGLAADASNASLLAAFQSGRLPATDHLRLTTREDTPIDALLHAPGDGSIPLSLVPREDADGALSVELLQPAATNITVDPSGIVVARLPGASPGTLRLLFLTPTLRPSGSRAAR